jgi:hypothetical protein
MPPCGCKPAGRSAQAVTPDRGAYAGGICERAIIDEVDAGTTSSPLAGAIATQYGVLAQAASLGLSERDHTVVWTQELIEHSHLTEWCARGVPSFAISA